MTRILVFGASITKGHYDRELGGWPNRLDLYIMGKDVDAPVYNLGVSGDTTADLMERMKSEVKSRLLPDEDLIILISAGINDSVIVDGNKERVKIEKFIENLKVLWLIAKRHAKKVIFVGFNPVDKRADPIPWRPEYSYNLERVGQFNQAAREFCQENDVDFIDVFSEWEREDYSRLLEDGLHPNAEGHEMIFQAVRRVLERKGLI